MVARIVGDKPSTLSDWGKVWKIDGEFKVKKMANNLFLLIFPAVGRSRESAS